MDKTLVAGSSPGLGAKVECPSCKDKFYDLEKKKALCPYCGHSFVVEQILKPRKMKREPEPVQNDEKEAESDALNENSGEGEKKDATEAVIAAADDDGVIDEDDLDADNGIGEDIIKTIRLGDNEKED